VGRAIQLNNFHPCTAVQSCHTSQSSE